MSLNKILDTSRFIKKLSWCFCLMCITLASYAQQKFNLLITVAQDGSGDYLTIQEAVNSVRDLGQQEVKILIKNGTYREKLVIPWWKEKISLIGENRDSTIIANCKLLGNQDTLYTATSTSRQYYLNYYIEGTTDFIFGEATVVFQSCTIKAFQIRTSLQRPLRPDKNMAMFFSTVPSWQLLLQKGLPGKAMSPSIHFSRYLMPATAGCRLQNKPWI